MDSHRLACHSKRIIAFAIALVSSFSVTACKVENPTPTSSTDSGSTGGTGTPKNVRVSWNPSNATDVSATGGGYKVYIRKGSPPTTSNTTPIVITNPGGGTHTTSTTTTLTPGQYYVAVASYSTNGDSPLSTSYILVVP